jgi:tetratricopeptide (TPR) repeat protein
MSKPNEAISGLLQLLETCSTDAEAWAELADLYFSQGMYQQAIFSLEEVLLIAPNAWNVSRDL